MISFKQLQAHEPTVFELLMKTKNFPTYNLSLPSFKNIYFKIFNKHNKIFNKNKFITYKQ